MCEKDHFEDDLKKYLRAGRVTRRDFGSLTAGAGLAMLLPRVANAQAVTETDVEIKTPDGTCDALLRAPVERRARRGARVARHLGPAPGVPADGQAARRIGLFGARRESVLSREARAGRARGRGLRRRQARGIVFPLAQALNATTHVSDAKAFVAWLDQQPPVDKGRKIGTTGYCMGGPITMRTAAAVADRVGAAASFHGGGLVTDEPGQPALARAADEGAVPVRRRRERRRARARSEERAARDVREGEAARRDRGVPGRHTAGARPIRRSTTKRRPSARGAACSSLFERALA